MRIEASELRDAARGLLDGVGAGSGGAAVEGEAWRAIVEAGWPALTVAEAYGGLEQTPAEAAVLYTELGRALSGAPLAASLIAADVLAACPPSGERDIWLERIAGGEPLAASLADPSAAALRTDGDGALCGTLSAVLGSERAGAVLALSAEPFFAAIVPLGGEGVEVSARPAWDQTRSLSEVRFAHVRLEKAAVLAEGPAARAAVEAGAAHLHFALAADCAGAADRILAETVDYLKTRRQFDRPLALFQALKHRCADLKAEVAAAEALIGEATRAGGLARAHAAKAFASAAFRRVAEEAVQLHGGIGMTAEHPCHRYLKRALLNQQLGLPDPACEAAVGRAALAEMAG